MRRAYRPPEAGKNKILSVAAAAGITLAVFLTLPLLQSFSGMGEIKESPAPLEIRTIPPSPPPPEAPPSPATTDALQSEEVPPAPETQPEPMNPPRIDLPLEVGIGSALQGDFDFSFPFAPDAGAGLHAFELSELDENPREIHRAPPVYPYALRRTGTSGSVTLFFIIAADGRVEHIEIERSTHREFERPALDAVRQWRFEPGTRNGEPVATRVRTTVQFVLE